MSLGRSAWCSALGVLHRALPKLEWPQAETDLRIENFTFQESATFVGLDLDATGAVAPPTACVSYMLTLPHGGRRPSSASRVLGSGNASSESRRNALRHLVLCEEATSR